MQKYNKTFVIAFSISLFVLVIPFFVTLMSFSGTNRAAVRPPPQQQDTESKGEGFGIVTALMKDTKTLSGLFVINFSPKDHQITMTNIPLQLQIDYGGSLWRMDELVSNIGVKGLMGSLEETFDIKGIRYAMFDTDGMIKLVDSVGKIEYNLPVPILTESGAKALEAGSQQLDGRRISLVLSSTDYANASKEGVERTAELFRSAVAYRLPHLTINSMESIFSLTANNSLNNLSYQDYHQLKPQIESLLSPNTLVTVYALKGQYTGDRGSFVPTSESLSKIKAMLS